MRFATILPLLLSVAAAPLVAQTAEPLPAEEEAEADGTLKSDILVVANRLIGQVDAAQAPIQTLDEAEIQSYGANSLADLVTALSPQTGSGRGRGGGRPVMLVNGQRVSSFREMRNFPPESIRKVEILPEEVALKYGYPPNQRVINFILKDNYSNRAVEFELRAPSNGGFLETQYEASLLKINKANRINLELDIEDSTMLTEAERNVRRDLTTVLLPMGALDEREYRSLVSDSRNITLNGSLAGGTGEGGSTGGYSLNAAFTRNDSRSLFGLDFVTQDNPLTRRRRTDTVEGGATLNRSLGSWRLTTTVDASHTATNTSTDNRRSQISDLRTSTLARSRVLELSSLATLNGSPARLPAGYVSATFKLGFDFDRIRSRGTQNGAEVQLKRGDLTAGFNVAIPIASRRENAMAGLGDLTLNFSGGLNRLSDLGTLTDWSAGLTWSPIEKLSLGASYIFNEDAPSLAQLGSPVVQNFNVPVYDFLNNQSVLATVTTGGNPLLRAAKNRDLKLSANWELPVLRNSSLQVEYFRNRSQNVAAGLPLLTPAIEAAFPGRVGRVGGLLNFIDQRPISLAESNGSRLRWGLNISGPFGKAAAPAAGGGVRAPGAGRPDGAGGPPSGAGRGPGGGTGRPPGAPGGPPGAGGPPGGAGGPPMGGPMMGGPMGGNPNGQGRWNLSVYHTYRFDESVLVAPGGPRLDLLAGDALTGGGVTRHALSAEGGFFYRGVGLRMNGSWNAPTRVRTPNSNLRFGSVTDVDLRLFLNFDQKPKLIKTMPFLKGFRISLEIENLFDSRQRVTDANGVVPISYQADYVDPKGRLIGFDIRKSF